MSNLSDVGEQIRFRLKKNLKPEGGQFKQELKLLGQNKFVFQVSSTSPEASMLTVCPHSGRGHRNSKLALVSQQDSFHVDKGSCQIAGEVRM